MKRVTFVAAAAVALLCLVSACGGGDAVTAPTPSGGSPPSAPETIQGIATPSSVSVVTATNAN